MKKIIVILLAFLMMLALCACGGNGNTSNKEANKMNDAIQIEAVKLEGSNYYNVKIRNMYSAETGEQPNRIMLQCQMLDDTGDLLETGYIIYEGLAYEQGGWSGWSCGIPYQELGAIKFVGYDFQYNTHNMNTSGTTYGIKMLGGGVFTEPIIVSVEDIEIS